MVERQDPNDLKVTVDECSNCGEKKTAVVILKGYSCSTGLCAFCVMAAASALLEEEFAVILKASEMNDKPLSGNLTVG